MARRPILRRLLVIVITGYFGVLSTRFRHELCQVLFFCLRNSFGLHMTTPQVSQESLKSKRADENQMMIWLRTFILTIRWPPSSSMAFWIVSIARSSLSVAAYYTRIGCECECEFGV